MNTEFKVNPRVQKYLEEAEDMSVVVRGERCITSEILLVVVMEDETNQLGKYISNREILAASFEEDFWISQLLNGEFIENCYELKDFESKYSKEVQTILNMAKDLSEKKGNDQIDENALIVSLIQSDNPIFDIMHNYSDENIGEWKKLFSTERFLKDEISEVETNALQENVEISEERENPSLNDSYCSSMFEVMNNNFKAEDSKVIFGRDKEIEKVLITFQKMTTRNIILIGEPGVGKTAIVEGLTERIVKKECPIEFQDKKVLSLDINGLLEDTMYLGQREEKFKALKRYLENHEDVILFIDEIHNIIGAGRTEGGSYDLANALKPILTNGKVRVIGATTHEEYNKYFANDGALKRRFQTLEVLEPKTGDLNKMLKGKKHKLERHHKVEVSEEAFETVVSQASGYHFDVANPARTIDVLDTAMVIAKNHGKKELDIKSILEVHEENIKNFKKMGKKDRKAIAYHETGHYILHKVLNTKFKNITLVSIIPAENYLGVNVFEEKDVMGCKTREDFINEIAECLAGDIASNLKGYDKNSGKQKDIEVASKIARKMILAYGMLSEDNNNLLGSYSSYAEKGAIITELLSDNQKEELARQVDAILKEAYQVAEETLKKKDKQLEIIADALVLRGSLNKSEIDGLYSGKLKIEDLPKSDLDLIK